MAASDGSAPQSSLELAAALARGPVVLDGGLATQLEAAGHDLSDELWSARLLADDPAAIVAAHRAFLDAGARVVTTASYQATVDGFVRRGRTAHEAAGLIRRSVDLAREAVDGRDGRDGRAKENRGDGSQATEKTDLAHPQGAYRDGGFTVLDAGGVSPRVPF